MLASTMKRRDFLSFAGLSCAGFALEPGKLLWTPPPFRQVTVELTTQMHIQWTDEQTLAELMKLCQVQDIPTPSTLSEAYKTRLWQIAWRDH